MRSVNLNREGVNGHLSNWNPLNFFRNACRTESPITRLRLAIVCSAAVLVGSFVAGCGRTAPFRPEKQERACSVSFDGVNAKLNWTPANAELSESTQPVLFDKGNERFEDGSVTAQTTIKNASCKVDGDTCSVDADVEAKVVGSDGSVDERRNVVIPETTTATATLLGEPSCTFTPERYSECTVSNETATFEVTIPGELCGAASWTTLNNDYTDNNPGNRTNANPSDESPDCSLTSKAALRITGMDYPEFSARSLADSVAGTSFASETFACVQAQTIFDDSLDKVVATGPNASVETVFTPPIPVCSARDTAFGSEGLNGDWTNCLSDDALTQRHGLKVNVSGETRILSQMTPPWQPLESTTQTIRGGEIKLAEQSSSGTISVGNSLPIGNTGYSIKLRDTIAQGNFTRLASIEILDSQGTVLKTDQLYEGVHYYWTAPTGENVRIIAQQVVIGNDPQNRLAELTAFTNETQLIDGERLQDSDWSVQLYWANKDYSPATTDTSPDALKKIAFVNESANNALVKLLPGENNSFSFQPAGPGRMSFEGSTLAPEDYATISATLVTPMQGFKVSDDFNCANYYVLDNVSLLHFSGPSNKFVINSPQASYEASRFYVNPQTREVYYRPSGVTNCYYNAGNASIELQTTIPVQLQFSSNNQGQFFMEFVEPAGNLQDDRFSLTVDASNPSNAQFSPNNRVKYVDTQGVENYYDLTFITERGTRITEMNSTFAQISVADRVETQRFSFSQTDTTSTVTLSEGQQAILACGVTMNLNRVDVSTSSTPDECIITDKNVTVTVTNFGMAVGLTIGPIREGESVNFGLHESVNLRVTDISASVSASGEYVPPRCDISFSGVRPVVDVGGALSESASVLVHDEQGYVQTTLASSVNDAAFSCEFELNSCVLATSSTTPTAVLEYEGSLPGNTVSTMLVSIPKGYSVTAYVEGTPECVLKE